MDTLFLVIAVWGAVGVGLAVWSPSPHGAAAVALVAPAKWLYGELAPQVLAIHVVGVGVFVLLGVPHGSRGVAGLALAGATTVGLLILVARVRTVHPPLQAALDAQAIPPVEAWTPPRSWSVTGFPFRPRDVERLADLPYVDRDGRPVRLDVYRRRDRVTPSPVLVQIHGGAWILGSKRQQGLPLMYRMAARGWVCVALEYRLSPKATWPAQLDDCRAGLAWVRDHIAAYGGDPHRIAVTGGSAGGHLTALVATLESTISAAVPFYGVYDWTNRFGHWRPSLVRLLERAVVKQPLAAAGEVFEAASPVGLVHDALPPMFVIACRDDALVPVAEPRACVPVLRQASQSPVLYAEVPYAEHAFDVLASRRTRHVIAAVDRFLSWAVTPHPTRATTTMATPTETNTNAL